MRKLTLLLVITLFTITPAFAEGETHGGGFAADPPSSPTDVITDVVETVSDLVGSILPF